MIRPAALLIVNAGAAEADFGSVQKHIPIKVYGKA